MNRKRRFLLRHKYGFTNEEITLYSNLNLGSDVKIESRYVSQRRYTELRKHLDQESWKSIIHNKWISSIYFSHYGVPQPVSYGFLHSKFGIDLQNRPLLNATHLENLVCENDLEMFVLKHIGGGKGDSVFIINKIERHESGLVYTTLDHKRLDKSIINEMITHQSGHLKGYKIEEFLDSHVSINRITGGGASSLRIYTLREKLNKVKVKFGFIRFGLPNGATDHLTNGAIYAPINLKKGTINKGICNADRIFWVSEHQTTGEGFVGSIIPFWDKVNQIVEKAAQSCPGLNWVGWDVVITDDGPYLIEGNVGMSLTSFQQSFGGLKENEILDEWIEHLDIPIPNGNDKGELINWKKRYIRSSLKNVIRK